MVSDEPKPCCLGLERWLRDAFEFNAHHLHDGLDEVHKFSSREYNALFWPPLVPDMHMIRRHTLRPIK